MGADNIKPWGEAIRSVLAAEPDRWFTAVELVDRYAYMIPPEDIQRRVEQRKRHGSSGTDHSAATTIIGGVLYTAIRQGHFERRLSPDGRLEVRAARTRTVPEARVAPSAAARAALAARARADAGLMTLVEAGAVIGVSNEQVRRYVRQGLLPDTKCENVWLVPAEDAHAFKKPLRRGDPRLKTLLADAGLMTAAEAGAVIGVSPQSVALYARRGLLPGTKRADVWWVVLARHVYGFKRPRRGRPLLQQRAWDCILEGQVDLGDPHRYANRGTVSRWSGDADAVAALLKRQGVVVGGAHAAAAHGAQLDPLADAAHIYVAKMSMNGGISEQSPMRGLVGDPLGEVVVRAVAADSWQRLSRRVKTHDGVLYAPAAAAALDMLLSPHPRERQAAEEYLEV